MQSTIDIIFRSKGAEQVTADINKIERQAKQASSSFGGMGDAFMGGAVGGAFGFLAAEAAMMVGQVAANMVQTMDAATQMENQLGRVNASLEEMNEIAQASNTSLQNTTQLYVAMSVSAGKYVNSAQEMQDLTETINKAMVVSGASAEAQSRAIVQLSQAFAGGVLRAEEWNSVIEASPYLLQEMSKHIDGANGDLGELRKMMLDGKLTTEVLIQALKDMSQSVDEDFAKTNQTVEQAMTNLNSSFTMFMKDVDDAVGGSDELKSAIVGLGETLKELAESPMWKATLETVGAVMNGIGMAFNVVEIAINNVVSWVFEALRDTMGALTQFFDFLAKYSPIGKEGFAEFASSSKKWETMFEEAMNNAIKANEGDFQDLIKRWDRAVESAADMPELVGKTDTAKVKQVKTDIDAATESLKAFKTELEEMKKAQAEGDFWRDYVMSPGERVDAKFTEMEARLEQAFSSGTILEGTFLDAIAKLYEQWYEEHTRVTSAIVDDTKNKSDEMSEIWKQAYRNMENSMSNFFMDVMQGNFDDLGASFVRMLQKMVADWAAAWTMMGLFGEGFGKPGYQLGGLIGGLFGSSASSSAAPAAATSSPSVNVNIQEAPGTRAETSAYYDPSKGLSLDIIIEKVEAGISKNLASGKGSLGSTMQSTYGLNRTVNSYR